jgi:hypothetical protein
MSSSSIIVNNARSIRFRTLRTREGILFYEITSLERSFCTSKDFALISHQQWKDLKVQRNCILAIEIVLEIIVEIVLEIQWFLCSVVS